MIEDISMPAAIKQRQMLLSLDNTHVTLLKISQGISIIYEESFVKLTNRYVPELLAKFRSRQMIIITRFYTWSDAIPNMFGVLD